MQSKPLSDLMASSIVSGSLLPRVSGKRTASKPAIVATTPMMKTGAGSQYFFSRSRRRQMMPPILATREQVPTAWFLMAVGKSSAA